MLDQLGEIALLFINVNMSTKKWLIHPSKDLNTLEKKLLWPTKNLWLVFNRSQCFDCQVAANCKAFIKKNQCDFCNSFLIEHFYLLSLKIDNEILVYNVMSIINLQPSNIVKIVQLNKKNARIVNTSLQNIMTLIINLIFHYSNMY